MTAAAEMTLHNDVGHLERDRYPYASALGRSRDWQGCSHSSVLLLLEARAYALGNSNPEWNYIIKLNPFFFSAAAALLVEIKILS